MINAIAHPTDFSPEAQVAFAHALPLAIASRCRLDLLHVHDRYAADHYGRFPHIREVLQRWGMLAPDAAVEDIAAQTGVNVRKVEIQDQDAVDGLSRFLIGHRPDLIVMATHGRDGLNRWLRGSMSAEVARETHAPVMLIGPAARPFVDPATGMMHLRKILAPIARDPSPLRALHTLEVFTQGLDVSVDFVHVGDDVPNLRDALGALLAVRQIDGPVIEGILAEAERTRSSLIAMPTAGHQGFLDAVRGRTTEHVVVQAPCPVLALPA
jgi:nucleotide-binding universal stress UspA family protein